jgi:histidyl-tRNA synthetase
VSSQRIQAPRGTYDVLPSLADERARLEQTAAKILERAGYGRIETPTFEATHLFSRTVGEATDVVQKEMYTFQDGSGDSLTLRPEGTAPVVRAYLEHGMHKQPQPVKLWYLSQFFRYERPQAGRFRQFWQIGAEAIGSSDPAVDAELILLLAELLEAIGARDVQLVLASLGRPESRAAYREELIAYLRANEDQLSREVVERIDLNPLRAFDAKHEPTQRVMAKAPRLIDRLPQEDLDHFAEVQDLLRAADLTYTVDTTLVRGLDYYTRTLFEFQSGALEAAQNTLGGGGRYDGLAEAIGGPATPGMGWAAGVERMLMASTQPSQGEPPVDLYVAYEPGHKEAAFKLAADARQAGHSARLELAGRSLKGQLKQASRIRPRYVAIFGADGVQLRDRDGGEDKVVAPETVMHHIRGNIL